MKNRRETTFAGSPAESAVVVGRWGHSGTHTHLVEVYFRSQNEGTPMERRQVLTARPLCNAGKGRHHAHGLQWDAEMNEKTVTCRGCQGFRLVEKQ